MVNFILHAGMLNLVLLRKILWVHSLLLLLEYVLIDYLSLVVLVSLLLDALLRGYQGLSRVKLGLRVHVVVLL